MPCGADTLSPLSSPVELQGRGLSAAPSVAACFEYVGRKKLYVIGGVTRRLYRFEGPGARVIVDEHDAYAMAAIPGLRQV